MKVVIIPQKQSGTGTIHDIASQHGDREIKFPKGSKYAVVLADYYGSKGYTTHKSETAAIQADRRNREYSRQIVGVDGWLYDVEGNELVRYFHQRQPYEVQSFEAVTEAATALGSVKSEAKAAAARANGQKGGRPRKVRHLQDLVIEIQDSSQRAIYADGSEPDSAACYGQTQFENGGLLDDKHFIINGEMANRAIMEYTEGDPSWLDEHGSRKEFCQWLVDEGWIESNQ